MARFTLPRDLYHGEGSLAELKNLKGKKAVVVVGGGSMKRFGFLQKVEDYLKEAGMEVALFEGVEPDPSVETVMKGAKLMQEFGPDWIVAICVQKQNSARFRLLLVQQLRLRHSALLPIIIRVSNIR